MSVAFSRVYVEHVLDPGYRNWKRLYYGDLLAVHKAHLIMLQETGVVSRAAAAAIKASMAAIEADTAFPDHLPDSLEDLFFLYEKELDRHGTGISASLHTARSRNDMDTTIFRLALKRELRDLVGRLASCARTILQRARAGESELTILSTHGQPANVSTMAHYLSAFLLEMIGKSICCRLGAE
jgi:argininosuccinate lyase